MQKLKTLGELKRSVYTSVGVRDEMRANLLRKLASGAPLFPGIIGFDDSVIPQIANAILSRHNFILLGLRGQAKSRILRSLVTLLDESIPFLAGCEINDDPLKPICRACHERLAEMGDDAPIDYWRAEDRYVEKLATPDVTIADIIGDLDPIKAARGGHALSSELTIHYGLLPRANRGIFAINELPDLAGKIQVGLFNIMQEGDVQIKGYPVRLPLDVALVFTANPEDYTARGKIITPLKDRIGSEIRTHYPASLEEAMAITAQEAWVQRNGGKRVVIPEFLREIVESIAFVARQEKRVDKRSGVSQRVSITCLENVLSSAEYRAVKNHEEMTVPRPSDVYSALPSLTGKVELEYEGEMRGADKVVRDIIRQACARVFKKYFDECPPPPDRTVVRTRRNPQILSACPRGRIVHSLQEDPGVARANPTPRHQGQGRPPGFSIGSGVHPGRAGCAQENQPQRGVRLPRGTAASRDGNRGTEPHRAAPAEVAELRKLSVISCQLSVTGHRPFCRELEGRR